MKFGIIRWKTLFLKCSLNPEEDIPFSPVHKALKFSTVFGTVLPNNPKITSP